MGFYLSPLVDIKENDVSATPQAVSTSISVNVIRCPKDGPEFKKLLITSEDDLLNTYGKPTNLRCNYEDMLGTIGNLINSQSVYCTGVRPSDATFAGIKSSSSTAPLSGSSTTFDISFETYGLSGSDALTLDDFVSKDPDDFAEDIFPEGPIDCIYYARGSRGNNIRIAFIDYETYNIIVRRNQQLDKYPWVQQLLSIDSPLNHPTEFLVLVEELLEDSDDAEKNWRLTEFYNVSTVVSALDDAGNSKFVENIFNVGSSARIRVALNELNKNKPWTYLTPNWIRFGGGSDGTIENLTDDIIIEAYDLYKDAEEIDVNVFVDGNKSETVKMHIRQLVENRKDCMAIFDPKYELVVNNRGSEAEALVAWRKGLDPYLVNNLNISSDRCALYGNWIEVYDRWNKKYRWIPISGYIAGIWAYNDWAAEPWYAPAGLNRAILSGSIRRLAWNPALSERDLLYKNGINPVASFAGIGKVVWGQKTLLDSTSSFNRINVRRLFLILEKSIATYVKYYLFEQNDEHTRYQLVASVEPFLRDVKARRGIYDYMIVCDERNNTSARIDRGELWCDIMIKPTRSAEFIVLRFTNTSAGANFSELTGSLGIDD